MFDFIGFSLFRIGRWCKLEQDEQSRRQSAKENEVKYYVDKNQKLRHTSTGRKVTLDDLAKEREYFDNKIEMHRYKMYADNIDKDNKDRMYFLKMRFVDYSSWEYYVCRKLSYQEWIAAGKPITGRTEDMIKGKDADEYMNNMN